MRSTKKVSDFCRRV